MVDGGGWMVDGGWWMDGAFWQAPPSPQKGDSWVTFFGEHGNSPVRPNRTKPNQTEPKMKFCGIGPPEGGATECNKVQQSATEIKIRGVWHWGEITGKDFRGLPWTSVDKK